MFDSSHEKFDVWPRPYVAFQKPELAGQTGHFQNETLAFSPKFYLTQ